MSIGFKKWARMMLHPRDCECECHELMADPNMKRAVLLSEASPSSGGYPICSACQGKL